jgi:hypothetical protein
MDTLIHYVGDVYMNSSLQNTVVGKCKFIYKHTKEPYLTLIYWSFDCSVIKSWVPFWKKI